MVASNDEDLALAVELKEAGISVVAAVDQRLESSDSALVQQLKQLQIPHLTSFAPVAAKGRSKVRALEVAPVDADRGLDLDKSRNYACDLGLHLYRAVSFSGTPPAKMEGRFASTPT